MDEASDSPVRARYGWASPPNSGVSTATTVHVDALALHYDSVAWDRCFLDTHPPGSPAYISYYGRISGGVTNWSTAQADRVVITSNCKNSSSSSSSNVVGVRSQSVAQRAANKEQL